ncbi:unnamed protein product [Gulo gulo]|uniref:Uncharacterized protein n=1 Tax=Gulo gulo TaxID=48420 RepID=A0A9X9M5R1_GULGU|nr:unnamed protein product [Gulo gulo]
MLQMPSFTSTTTLGSPQGGIYAFFFISASPSPEANTCLCSRDICCVNKLILSGKYKNEEDGKTREDPPPHYHHISCEKPFREVLENVRVLPTL